MTDIEHRLRSAMHAAVDGELAPADLVTTVMRRHRRHLAKLAVAAVAGAIVAAAVPVAIASRGASHGRPVPIVSGSTRTPEPVRSSSSPAPKRSKTLVHVHQPAWIRGLPLPATTDLRLLLTGRHPAWFSTATGALTPIGGLPRSRFPISFTRLRSGWAARPVPKGALCTPFCPDPMGPAYFIADGSAVARRVGVTEELGPGSLPGTMWFETYPKGTNNLVVARATAQEVTSSGRRIGSPVRLPAGYLIQQGVGADVLLSPVSQGPGPVIYKLLDPATGGVVRSLPGVIAAGASQIAWGICAGCSVHVLDVRTGASASVAIPRRVWAYDGAFSADGRFLAVNLSGGVTPNGRATLARIAVIDLRTLRLRLLQGSAVGVDVPYEALTYGWRGGGDTLIAAVTNARPVVQIGTWHPGAARLRVRKFPVPAGMTVDVGPYG